MYKGCFCTNILYFWSVTLNIWQTTLMHDSTQLSSPCIFFKEKNNSLFSLGILSTMLRNYSAWWCHHWEQHIDTKSVAQVDWQMDPCLQLERWLKAEDDFVQHHLGMHTLVTQSFLLLTSFASDWRSVSSIDLGFTNIFRKSANLQMKSVKSKQTPLFFLHFLTQQLLQFNLCFLISFSLSSPNLWKSESPNALTHETLCIMLNINIFFFYISSVSWSFPLGTFSLV